MPAQVPLAKPQPPRKKAPQAIQRPPVETKSVQQASQGTSVWSGKSLSGSKRAETSTNGADSGLTIKDFTEIQTGTKDKAITQPLGPTSSTEEFETSPKLHETEAPKMLGPEALLCIYGRRTTSDDVMASDGLCDYAFYDSLYADDRNKLCTGRPFKNDLETFMNVAATYSKTTSGIAFAFAYLNAVERDLKNRNPSPLTMFWSSTIFHVGVLDTPESPKRTKWQQTIDMLRKIDNLLETQRAKGQFAVTAFAVPYPDVDWSLALLQYFSRGDTIAAGAVMIISITCIATSLVVIFAILQSKPADDDAPPGDAGDPTRGDEGQATVPTLQVPREILIVTSVSSSKHAAGMTSAIMTPVIQTTATVTTTTTTETTTPDDYHGKGDHNHNRNDHPGKDYCHGQDDPHGEGDDCGRDDHASRGNHRGKRYDGRDDDNRNDHPRNSLGEVNRQPLLCTMGATTYLPLMKPHDGLCDYLFFDSIYKRGISTFDPPDEIDNDLYIFVEKRKGYRTTAFGISFSYKLKGDHTSTDFGIAVFDVEYEDFANTCHFANSRGSFSRLKAIRQVMDFFRANFKTPSDTAACLRLAL
ncbi:hypothetical protein HPB50_019463 [Hyalomma asiaticum]|uniref:Uncharacterized protein n=1 Tax=Hyalomma asiaticum TaxID=266040 RepID=A0ACB7TB19_HYAAI|nr:hypothetical protein HPB50_019463 [Hyalomma asiaticum]